MFAIRIIQPEGHPRAAGIYVAECLRAAADRVQSQTTIEEGFIARHADGHIMYEWTTVEAPPPEVEGEAR